jgi:hypothetical protein
MKKETLYASLAGCASFFLIAYGSYRYFSPAERIVDSTTENVSVPAGPVVEIPAAVKEPPPLPGKPSAADNASPAAARPLPSTPTAYGAASVAGPATVELNARDDEEGGNRYSNRKKSAQARTGRKAGPNERRRTRSLAEED